MVICREHFAISDSSAGIMLICTSTEEGTTPGCVNTQDGRDNGILNKPYWRVFFHYKIHFIIFQIKSSKNVYVKYQTEEHILGDRRNDLT